MQNTCMVMHIKVQVNSSGLLQMLLPMSRKIRIVLALANYACKITVTEHTNTQTQLTLRIAAAKQHKTESC